MAPRNQRPHRTHSVLELFSFFYPFFKPQQKLFGITLIFVCVKLFSDLFVLLSCKAVLQIIEHASTASPAEKLPLTDLVRTILDPDNAALSIADLPSVVMLMGVGILLFVGGGYVRQFLPTIMVSHISFDIRRSLYGRLQRMDLSFFHINRSGEITTRLTSDIMQGVQVFGHTLTIMIYQLVLFPFIVFYMFRTNVLLTLIALCVGIIFLFNSRFFWTPLRTRSRDVQEKLGKISGELNEKLRAVKVTQSFTNEPWEMNIFSSAITNFRSSVIAMGRLRTFHSILGQTIPTLGSCVLLTAGAVLIIHDQLTFASLTFIWLMRERLFVPFQMFTNMSEQVFAGLGALDRVYEFFRLEPSVGDAENAVDLRQVTGKVTFKNVSFTYPNRPDEPVLQNVCFTLEPGRSVAFIGRSGAGKTTAVDLLSRFYDPDEGCIYIDGNDIRRYSLKSLRSHIGVVLQEAILFSGTIKENVRYGRPKASDAEIRESLVMANAWDFIENMHEGIHTIIGENGVSLSGGQKQRIAIARAFLKDPAILVLDEATSSLDTISEFQVQEAMGRLMKNRTTIVIAHRLSTIANVDMILVFENGRIVERGSHAELLANVQGHYARFFKPQMSPFHFPTTDR